MKRILPPIVLALFASTGALATPRLEPCDKGFLDEYNERVEAIAQSAMPGPPEFWVTAIPSFTPEWSVGLTTVNGRHLLTHVELDRSFWHSSWVESGPSQRINDPSKGYAKAKARTAVISAALRDALRTEWEKSINAARNSETYGFDGETYLFHLPGKCASTWSPDAGTRSKKLVELVEQLARLARARGKAPDSKKEAKVLASIRDLPKLVD